jgi:hypothetical protein
VKLRFRKNTLRLRVNQREVEDLAAGNRLEEVVHFPADARLAYILSPCQGDEPAASLESSTIRISAPQAAVKRWATSEEIGLYFEVPANGTSLQVAIEKDLECLDGPPEEQDPYAYPREVGKSCN